MKPRRAHPAKPKLISPAELVRRDTELLHTVDHWLERANQRGGEHIACRRGCAQCCMGAFAIDRLDAIRLQRGLSELAERDAARAQRILQRAAESLERIAEFFPGNSKREFSTARPKPRSSSRTSRNDEPCPALDPATLTCDLYAHRPMTCRVFGPPVRSEDGLGVCELCFTAAGPEEIAAAEVPLEGTDQELALNRELERATGPGETIVAFALLGK